MATGALVEEIALELEEAAVATRKINSVGVGYFLGGVCVGAAIGFYFGYRYNRQKIYAEAFEQSEKEVEEIRKVYQAKIIAAVEKPAADEIIRERGYAVDTSEHERPLPAPVPIIGESIAVDAVVTESKDKNEGWDYPKELSRRTPEKAYVIHQDEFSQRELEYTQVAYTYYERDDVLCGEDDKPLPHADVTVGRENLRFGHGSDDVDVVFVRNDKLELEMEICRSHRSYEEDVLGHDIQHSHHRGHRRDRRR